MGKQANHIRQLEEAIHFQVWQNREPSGQPIPGSLDFTPQWQGQAKPRHCTLNHMKILELQSDWLTQKQELPKTKKTLNCH